MTGRRPYRTVRRLAQAQQTRSRVAEAALKLLLERGYAETTIDAIAAEAGVGQRTVYDLYGSKAGILRGLLESFAPAARPDFESRVEALAEDPDGQLRLAVDFTVSYFAAAGPFLELVWRTAQVDSALSAAAAQGEAMRRASQQPMVQNWVRRGALRPGLGRIAAADILWAMTSPSLYHLVVQERRWSRRRYSRWLQQSLAEMLFGSSGGSH